MEHGFQEGQKVVCISQDFPVIKKYGGSVPGWLTKTGYELLEDLDEYFEGVEKIKEKD